MKCSPKIFPFFLVPFLLGATHESQLSCVRITAALIKNPEVSMDAVRSAYRKLISILPTEILQTMQTEKTPLSFSGSLNSVDSLTFEALSAIEEWLKQRKMKSEAAEKLLLDLGEILIDRGASIKTGRRVKEQIKNGSFSILPPEGQYVQSLLFSPDSKNLILHSYNGVLAPAPQSEENLVVVKKTRSSIFSWSFEEGAGWEALYSGEPFEQLGFDSENRMALVRTQALARQSKTGQLWFKHILISRLNEKAAISIFSAPEQAWEAITPVMFTKKGERVVFVGRGDKSAFLVTRNLKNGAPSIRYLPPNNDLERSKISANGRYLFFASRVAPEAVVFVVDLETDQPVPAVYQGDVESFPSNCLFPYGPSDLAFVVKRNQDYYLRRWVSGRLGRSNWEQLSSAPRFLFCLKNSNRTLILPSGEVRDEKLKKIGEARVIGRNFLDNITEAVLSDDENWLALRSGREIRVYAVDELLE